MRDKTSNSARQPWNKSSKTLSAVCKLVQHSFIRYPTSDGGLVYIFRPGEICRWYISLSTVYVQVEHGHGISRRASRC